MRPHRSAVTRTLLAVAGTTALIGMLAACGDSDGDGAGGETPTGETSTASAEPTPEDVTDAPTSEEPTDEATSADAGATEAPGIEDVPTADVGACLNAVDLIGGGGVSEITTVDCTEEHDAQVFAIVELPDGEYPGDDAITTTAVDECEPAFESFVGTPPAESTLEFDGLPPSADTWAVGDRDVICLAFYPDLSTTTETFEGSGI